MNKQNILVWQHYCSTDPENCHWHQKLSAETNLRHEVESQLAAAQEEIKLLKAELDNPCRQCEAELQKQGQLEHQNQKLILVIRKAIMRLGAPTMEYEPTIELRELKDSNEEAIRILQKALQD